MGKEMNYGVKLLADLIDWPIDEILESLKFIGKYNYHPQPKKTGGIRKIYAPHKEMKKLQRAILKKFLYRIPLINGQEIMGCVPQKSYVENAKLHCGKKERNFFLRLDLEDAFPNIKAGYLKKLLRDILVNEVKRLQGEQILEFKSTGLVVKSEELVSRSLFSWHKVRWFRKLIKQNDPKLFEVIEQFLDHLIAIVTYKKIMIQGIPTSPWLLNLVVAYTGVLEKLKDYLESQRLIIIEEGLTSLSLYVDDFIISLKKSISWQQINEVKKIIELVPVFRINVKKTTYSSRKRIAPMVTGLRIIEMPDQKIDEHLMVAKKIIDSLGIEEEKKDKLIIRRESSLRRETHLEARLPKQKIRRIRGILFRASQNQENYEKLKNIARGHLANLRQIYGEKIPSQIVKPHKRFMEFEKKQFKR